MFKILLGAVNPSSGKELASTQYSDHASLIAKAMANLYGYRVNVFQEEHPGVEARLVEYWDYLPAPASFTQLTRVPLDPRTGQPYA